MENIRKRQREVLDHQEDPSLVAGSSDGQQPVTGENGREEAEATASPSDEEVEEFYAILNRVREAVKYLKSKGHGMGVEGGRWTAVVEAEAAAAMVADGEEEEGEEVDVRADDNNKLGRVIDIEEEDGKGAEEEMDLVGGGDLLLDLNSSPKDGCCNE